MSARSIAVAVLLVAGVGLQALSCLGIAVMRDTLDRLHYVGPASFGVFLVAVAIVVQESFSLIGDKALATAAVLVVTGPVLAHVTARSIRLHRQGDWRIGRDEDVEVEG